MSFHKHTLRDKAHQLGTVPQSGGVDSVLAALFQKILFDLRIRENQFHRLMESFLMNPRNARIGDVKDRSRARGNLKKELFKSTMTWRVFIKAMRFLNIPKFELVIRLHHHNKTITEHDIVVALDIMSDEEMFQPDTTEEETRHE
jgi:hypothetical protein